MFGAKTKRQNLSTSVSNTSTMSAVNQKIDELQNTLDQEQNEIAGDSTVDSRGGLHNVIGKGTLIEGNVQAEGDLVIEGVIKGDVTTKTKLVVGPSAMIEGNLLSQHAEIAGRVQGTVKALGLLVINSSGTILGDVITKDLNVESGSTFYGRLQVGGSITSTPIEIAKVSVVPTAEPVATDSVFESLSAESPVTSDTESFDDTDKTAEQLAANLSRSALLH